jgi:hypothetical protein
MKRATFYRRLGRRASQLLVWAAALTVLACNNEVSFNPTAPTFGGLATITDSTPVGAGRNLRISGSLTVERGSCLQATVLYDGEELPGARTVCPEVTGCATLDLAAVVSSTAGHHSISFQVLGQSPELVDYLAKGSVRVSREGLAGVFTIPLEATRAALRSGESVTFEVDFLNLPT